jgi:hypothetical protein
MHAFAPLESEDDEAREDVADNLATFAFRMHRDDLEDLDPFGGAKWAAGR